MLSQTASLTPFSLPALSALLEEIVGFFLIESHVVRTTNSFRAEQDVEDLWDGMCERVVRIVHEGLAECEDPEIFLGTKFKVLTFVQTLEVSTLTISSHGDQSIDKEIVRSYRAMAILSVSSTRC